jgi:hypothetical protein
MMMMMMTDYVENTGIASIDAAKGRIKPCGQAVAKRCINFA